MNESDWIWNRLILNCRMTCAQNQSIVENRLPFGMKRMLTPLRLGHGQGQGRVYGHGYFNASLTPSITELKDPWIEFNRGIRRATISANITRKPLIAAPPHPQTESNANPNNPQKFKFVQQKIASACSSGNSGDFTGENFIKFDPSALLFFKDDSALSNLKTNLTSNANGTVSCDKNHLGAILNQSCWLISLPDLLSFDCQALPQTMNNKLRALKFAEFIAQKWGNIDGFGNGVEFAALTRDTANGSWTALMSNRCTETGICMFIIRDGEVVHGFKAISRMSNPSFMMELKVEIEIGDLIVFIKAKESDKVSEMISKMKFDFGDDMESYLLERLKNCPISCLLVSRVQYTNEFDEYYNLNYMDMDHHNILYNCHLDTKVGMIVNEPIPGSFGCTTRHSVIYRRGYFAALHHDASKINRFPDTINYIIRKLSDPKNLGKRLEQEGDEKSLLKRISDIQYFSYLLRKPNGRIILGLGGGSKCILLREMEDYEVAIIKIFEVPILLDITGELKLNDNLILLSPHFPSFMIKNVSIFDNLKDWMKELLNISSVDVQSFKVSMAHFIYK